MRKQMLHFFFLVYFYYYYNIIYFPFKRNLPPRVRIIATCERGSKAETYFKKLDCEFIDI